MLGANFPDFEQPGELEQIVSGTTWDHGGRSRDCTARQCDLASGCKPRDFLHCRFFDIGKITAHWKILPAVFGKLAQFRALFHLYLWHQNYAELAL